MKLTKAQRHKFYKLALETFGKPRTFKLGICSTLAFIIDDDFVVGENVSELFPELLRFKPSAKSPKETWWDLDDIKSRQTVLCACILETTPKKYSRQSKKVK